MASQTSASELSGFAAHLATRRKAILAAWRDLVDADPELTTPASLPRTQFYDHIPEILDDLGRRLSAGHPSPIPGKEGQDAAAHGMQRWQQGYELREAIREWGHLQVCLVAELEAFAEAQPDVTHATMVAAQRALTDLCNRGIAESTTKYFELREKEAEGNVRDMEMALELARALEQRRAVLWQEAAHDLRGNLSVVTNAAAGLSIEALPSAAREKFVRLLQQSVASLSSMLNEVADLSRLQAGREHLDAQLFDAGTMLMELCNSLQDEASARGLHLRAEGGPLVINGDRVKLRRIAQNLLLNALKYTQSGGATVRWGASRENDPGRWMFSVEDTGPGFHAGPGAPLAGALEDATQEARRTTKIAGSQEPSREEAPDARPIHQERGEGIGLSIVKRLCELLGATLEMESKPGAGTTMSVFVPRQYRRETRE